MHARARARARVCVCVCVCARVHAHMCMFFFSFLLLAPLPQPLPFIFFFFFFFFEGGAAVARVSPLFFFIWGGEGVLNRPTIRFCSKPNITQLTHVTEKVIIILCRLTWFSISQRFLNYKQHHRQKSCFSFSLSVPTKLDQRKYSLNRPLCQRLLMLVFLWFYDGALAPEGESL